MKKVPEEHAEDQQLSFVCHAPSQRLDLFLQFHLPGKTRSFIQRLIRDGCVLLNGEAALKPSRKLKTGDQLRIELPRTPSFDVEPRYVPFSVVYEDDHLVVINKPPGVMVHPVSGGTETTLVHGLLYRIKDLSGMAGTDRPGIVHRLDRDTSGIMVVAKNDVAHHRLAVMFKARTMQKAYIAVCRLQEPVQGGVVDLPIGRSLRNRKKMAIRYDTGRSAITEYWVSEIFGSHALVNAYPRSGRTHQIRVHLSYMGLPIICDRYYSDAGRIYQSTLKGVQKLPNEKPVLARQALHARMLTFTHPVTGRRMCFEAALPADLCRLVGLLRRTFPVRKVERD